MSDYMIDSLKNSNKKLFAILSGGGYSFINNFTISGTSKYFMGANVLSDSNMIIRFLGYQPDKFCSEEVALAFANNAYTNCLRVNINSDEIIGLGVTCSLVTDNERIGREHNVYIALRTKRVTITSNIRLDGYNFSCLTEDNLVNITIKTMVFDVLNNSIHDKNYTIYNDNYLKRCIDNLSQFKNLLVFSGSFNPIHEAHLTMHKMAQKHFNRTCILEITDNHPDKGVIGHKELSKRVDKIRDCLLPVIITDASTYFDKVTWYKQRCKELESIVFVVGADTWDRIRNSTKYNNISSNVLFDYFYDNNVQFLVFNRNNVLTKDDKWDKLVVDCQDARLFDNQTSSTKIRKKL